MQKFNVLDFQNSNTSLHRFLHENALVAITQIQSNNTIFEK